MLMGASDTSDRLSTRSDENAGVQGAAEYLFFLTAAQSRLHRALPPRGIFLSESLTVADLVSTACV